MELFRGARLEVSRIYGGHERSITGRHKALDVYQMVQLSYGQDEEKMHRYGQLLRAMLRDQIRWIYDRDHVRALTHENGRESLALAVAATHLADQSTRKP